VSILSELIGEDRSLAWKNILVGRDYYLEDLDEGTFKYKGINHKPYRYEVGQPMGALSSWAMLALTHHLIVQLAYQRSYPVVKRDDHGERV